MVVLTHHPRPALVMEGGTTFHFLDLAPAEALARAKEPANGDEERVETEVLAGDARGVTHLLMTRRR